MSQFLQQPDLSYPLTDLLDDAAEYCQVSQETIKDYLGKAASPRYGMYSRVTSESGERYVILKPEFR